MIGSHSSTTHDWRRKRKHNTNQAASNHSDNGKYPEYGLRKHQRHMAARILAGFAARVETTTCPADRVKAQVARRAHASRFAEMQLSDGRPAATGSG